ncbi:MAG TPA: Smr/MutS family protein [Polyangiaceae bacterium]|nr:Smr/MutS family protein [Polyangiaceae bacterium]
MTGRGKKGPAAGPFDALRALKKDLPEQPGPSGAKPPLPRSTPSERDAGDDDALLLHRLYAGVEPLDRTRGRVPTKGERPAPKAASPDASLAADSQAVHEQLRTLVEGGARFEVSDDGRRVEGRRLDVAPDLVRRMRRGLFPLDARLDMHGMGAQEARAALEVFLRAMRVRGERCVLVIHGKGEHSPGGAGILRGEIGAWLSQGAASEHVAAFATAQTADGGEGAVYVLIRR